MKRTRLMIIVSAPRLKMPHSPSFWRLRSFRQEIMKNGRTKRRMSVEKLSTQFARNAFGLFQTELNWFSSDLYESVSRHSRNQIDPCRVSPIVGNRNT